MESHLRGCHAGGKAAGGLHWVRRLHGTLPAEPGRACGHEGDGGDPEEIPEGTINDSLILSGTFTGPAAF